MFFRITGAVTPTDTDSNACKPCDTCDTDLGGSIDIESSRCAQYKGSIVCMHLTVSIFTNQFNGLMTMPCHALVDTGAQEAFMGLWHAQRWILVLAHCYKLQPVFLPVPPNTDAGGVGGSAKIIAIADFPHGFGGINGLTRWAIADDPAIGKETPPLVPNNLITYH